jgi:glycosyltransferase involved in cell wall biosynthesis
MINPSISIIIPCRNEETYISECLESIISNNYPKEKIEVFVIDGLSTDNTINIVQDYILRFPFIGMISNPNKIFPSAVNIGIKHSHGDFIFIIGAHAKYNYDYFSKCIESGLKYNADNIGGVLLTVPDNNTIVGKLITSTLMSPFGVGNSKFRTGSSEIIETDTVFGGCYKKEVFLKHGFFNEKMVSTSDYEFNRRIKKHGAKIILDPDIIVTYYTRSTLLMFLKNNIRNGFWAIYPIALADHFPVSIRHLVPLTFFISLFFSLMISFFLNGFFLVFSSIILVYFITSFIYSLKVIHEFKFYIIFLPILFFILHFSYGLGSFYGLFKAGLSKTFLSKSIEY